MKSTPATPWSEAEDIGDDARGPGKRVGHRLMAAPIERAGAEHVAHEAECKRREAQLQEAAPAR